MIITDEFFNIIVSSAAQTAADMGLEPIEGTFHEGRGVIMTALSYGGRDPLSADRHPSTGRIGAFAENNNYRELAKRLQRVLKSLVAEFSLDPAECRVFCNSRLPEKSLARKAGLGQIGKNSLLLLPGRGSFCVLGGILLPAIQSGGNIPVDAGEGLREWPFCGDCDLCMKACPTRAITSPGVVDRDLCLQGLAARDVRVPPEIRAVWGDLFYGCDICQNICPHNKRPAPPAESRCGHIGPFIELGPILTAGDSELRKAVFQGTVLDQGWISPVALKRNALFAAAYNNAEGLLPLIETYASHPSPLLRETAAWAKQSISRSVSET